MKKNILIASLLLITSTVAFAKPKGGRGGGSDSKFSIGVSVGAGIPMGDFSKAPDPTSTDSTKGQGAAKLGFHFNVNASYMFTENIGATLLIGGNMHSVDVSKFPTFPGVTYSAGSFYVGQYMVDLLFSFPINDALSLQGKVLVGLMTISYPSVVATFGTATNTTATSSGSGFAYGVGVGGKYKLSDMIGLHLNIDYIGANPSSTGYTSTPSSGSAKNNTTLKQTMATSLLNTSVGVSFSF